MENRIGFGYVIIRLFTRTRGSLIVHALNQSGFGATVIKAEGAVAKVDIVETVVRRTDIRKVEELMRQHDADAFHAVEDVRTRHRGIFAKYL